MYLAMRERAGTNDPDAVMEWLMRWTSSFLKSPRFVGSGGEGLVFAEYGWIHKFLVNWSYPRRDADQTQARLEILADKIYDPLRLYNFCVRRPTTDIIWISYKATPGKPVGPHDFLEDTVSRTEKELVACLEELAAKGYGHSNPKPSNFVWDDSRLRLVDYGSDCRPIQEAIFELSRIVFIEEGERKHKWEE